MSDAKASAEDRQRAKELLAAAERSETRVVCMEEPTEIVKYDDIVAAAAQPTNNALLAIIAGELRQMRVAVEQVWLRVEEAVDARADDDDAKDPS